ncbi:PREDICTED: interferon-like [Sturnus vulgaris]|uniref:interferon-like n=1 Tax=Sturnus vulgaris TaxID=9172 RepID=UPI00071A9F75|nr:PREDICTED: interferon-like [Sturnus vulgaris]
MAVPGCAQPCQWHSTLALLLLIVAPSTSLPCHHLRTHDIGDALQLLQDMAPSHAQPCHLQERPFFPDTLPHNNLLPRQAAATALRILQHLFHTLSTNATRQHWPAQPRSALLNKLQHHVHHLEQCLPDNAALFQGPRNALLTINKYFSRIQSFLHAHNHSACAWDHVRLEARICFQYVDRLIRQMKHQAALDPTKPTESKHPSPASTSGHGLSGDSSSPSWDHSVPVRSLSDQNDELIGKGV